MQKGSIMNKSEEKNNPDVKSVTDNTVSTTNTLSYMSQRQISSITDKVKNQTSISGFIILSSSDFKHQVWIIKSKFLEITKLMGSTQLEYPLKKAIQGNANEGKKTVEGKALRINVEEKIVSISVYTQSYGEVWSLSHTHQIAKNVFDAYVLVLKNDQDVSELEKESKIPKNFSLNLS